MTNTFQTKQPYGLESTGVTVLATCGMLSLISVLGIIIILGMSVVWSHRSSNKTPFVRSQVARYFLSLLICNLLQGIGALFVWIFETRVEIGLACTAHAIIAQLGDVGTAIFTFVIAAHTSSQLVLRRQWSDLTCHIVLFASWGLFLLNSGIGYFIVANPERGAYYGTAGYWCRITPAYPTERYASDHLIMLGSAVFSSTLYSFVFLRLRGNTTVSGGYNLHFHHRSKFNVGIARSSIATDDLTTVAKQMLWHPIAYTVLVLPICTTAFCTFPDRSVPFLVTVSTTSVFVLSGFVNVVLFCTTRKALPGSWKRKFGISTTLCRLPSDSNRSSGTDVMMLPARTGRRIGARPASITISIIVDKDVETKYDEAEQTASSLNFNRISLPTEPLRTHATIRDSIYGHHIRQISFPPPLRMRLDGDKLDWNLSTAVHPASKANRIAWRVPEHPVHSYRGRESGMDSPTLGCEAHSPVYPYARVPPPVNANTRNSWSPSIPTSKTSADQFRLSRPGLASYGSGLHWTGNH